MSGAYRLAVCDDESLDLEGNRAMAASVLTEAGIAHEIDTFPWADALLSRVPSEPGCFDMLILDILLGEDNGVALARSLRDAGYQGGIIFVTNAREFTPEGYSVYPTHYLLKPLRKDTLRSGQTLPVGRMYYEQTMSLLTEHLQD